MRRDFANLPDVTTQQMAHNSAFLSFIINLNSWPFFLTLRLPFHSWFSRFCAKTSRTWSKNIKPKKEKEVIKNGGTDLSHDRWF